LKPGATAAPLAASGDRRCSCETRRPASTMVQPARGVHAAGVLSFLWFRRKTRKPRCPATTFLWTSAASPLPGCMKPARRKRSISATANGFAVRSRNLKDIEEAFMQALQTVNRISFKNILFLTDFSDASETALAYATGFARHFGAQI